MNNQGSVYFIQNINDNSIKIGFSKNPKRRLKQLQTSNSTSLKLIYVIDNASMNYEKSLHKFFELERIQGEWFKAECVLRWIHRHKLEIQTQKELGLIK